jgi:hypothetical protein
VCNPVEAKVLIFADADELCHLKLFVKYMISKRCELAVKEELKSLDYISLLLIWGTVSTVVTGTAVGRP